MSALSMESNSASRIRARWTRLLIVPTAQSQTAAAASQDNPDAPTRMSASRWSGISFASALRNSSNSQPAVLLGRRFQAIDVTTVGVFDFAAALTVFRSEKVAEDGEEPRGHIRSRLERIEIGHGTQQGLLHKIVRAVDVAAERDRERA